MNPGARDPHDDVPGRIPESLIHAALDGEVSDDMQREIADALKYDKTRHRELLDTADAIRALCSEVDTPDFAGAILGQLDRNNRFIPSSWQRHVRTGRLGIAAVILLSLVGVAGLQRVYPRLATMGDQHTPVRDVRQAVETDTTQFEQCIREEVQAARATMMPSPVVALRAPGRTNYAFSVDVDDQTLQTSSFSGGFQVMSLPSGNLVYIVTADPGRAINPDQIETHIRTVSWSRALVMPDMLGGLADDQFPNREPSAPVKPGSRTLELP